MRIYFVTHSHNNTGRSGSNVYHHNLAKVFLSWGWEVRSLDSHISQPYNCEGVEVYTLAEHHNNEVWADVVITHPGPDIWCRVKKKRVIIKHNGIPEDKDYRNDKILYCGEAARQSAKMQCYGDFVWNPGNRFYNTDKRGNPDGPWMLINCNENKGGRHLIQLAELLPDKQFVGVLGSYGPQIKHPLKNLSYWPGISTISDYYQQAAGLLLLSKNEGFPTVAMEAMSHGLPVIGNSDCAGIVDVCRRSGMLYDTVEAWSGFIKSLSSDWKYMQQSAKSLARAESIEQNRDFEGLKKFFEG